MYTNNQKAPYGAFRWTTLVAAFGLVACGGAESKRFRGCIRSDRNFCFLGQRPNGVQALAGGFACDFAMVVWLAGPNGAGKSTLMRTLTTLQEADSGTAFLDELDVLRKHEDVRRHLGCFGIAQAFHPPLFSAAVPSAAREP